MKIVPLLFCLLPLLPLLPLQLAAQQFTPGAPLGAVDSAGNNLALSANVKVFGSFLASESCTFDPQRNLILAMNAGDRAADAAPDGYVALINPDGSVHTLKWIGATRDGLELKDPLGSALHKGVLYAVDSGFLRTFDLASGQPLASFAIPGASALNGIAVAEDGTAYISNSSNPQVIYKVSPQGAATVFVEGEVLSTPNGVAMDRDGNIVVVNIGDNAVLTFDPSGKLLRTEYTVESGNDGLVVTEDGTRYVSSVRYGSISRIRPGQEAELIASGIPTPASMCYDSVQKQLVIPLNRNNSLAFIRL